MPQPLFLLRRQVWIAKHVDDATPLYHTIGAHHLRHRLYGGHLHDGNTGLFQFGRDRSAAASRGASGGGEDHRIDAILLQLGGDLPPQAPAVGQRIGQPRGGDELVVQLANHAAFLQIA